MRKIYIVPNLVTTANLFAGFYSIIATFQGDFSKAAWAILVASIFDALDGRIARMARATSSFGVEYDSLSDIVSFGLAPAFLMYAWVLQPYGRLGWIAAFLFLACGGLRLARFNVTTQKLPKNYFLGLPIPGSALTLATYVIFQMETQWFPEPVNRTLVLVMVFGLAALMVSLVKFPSFKELNWRSRATFGYLMILVILLVLVALKPEVTTFLIFVAYIALSLLWNVWLLISPSPKMREERSS